MLQRLDNTDIVLNDMALRVLHKLKSLNARNVEFNKVIADIDRTLSASPDVRFETIL
jgi:hypothetical protein